MQKELRKRSSNVRNPTQDAISPHSLRNNESYRFWEKTLSISRKIDYNNKCMRRTRGLCVLTYERGSIIDQRGANIDGFAKGV